MDFSLSKKILLLCLISACCPLSSVSAATYQERIGNFFYNEGYISGQNNTGDLQLEAQINRAEFAKILYQLSVPGTTEPHNYNCFPDVQTEWYAPYVCWAKDLGYIHGYDDGLFRPGKTISYVEAGKIITRWGNLPHLSFYGDSWFSPYVRVLSEKNILLIHEHIREYSISRGETFDAFMRIMALQKLEKSRFEFPHDFDIFLAAHTAEQSIASRSLTTLESQVILEIITLLKQDISRSPLTYTFHIDQNRFDGHQEGTLILQLSQDPQTKIYSTKIQYTTSNSYDSETFYLAGSFIKEERVLRFKLDSFEAFENREGRVLPLYNSNNSYLKEFEGSWVTSTLQENTLPISEVELQNILQSLSSPIFTESSKGIQLEYMQLQNLIRQIYVRYFIKSEWSRIEYFNFYLPYELSPVFYGKFFKHIP